MVGSAVWYRLPFPSVPSLWYIRCAADTDMKFLWTGLIVWPYKNHNILDLFGKELESLIHLFPFTYHRQASSPAHESCASNGSHLSYHPEPSSCITRAKIKELGCMRFFILSLVRPAKIFHYSILAWWAARSRARYNTNYIIGDLDLEPSGTRFLSFSKH